MNKFRRWRIFFYDPLGDILETGIYKGWYDGPIYVIRLWRLGIDLSDTRLGSWLLRGWFDE
jgi:hypothetical protein